MEYDVIIIGGGTGGSRASSELSHEGKKVLMIEPAQLGGTCLNKGCIPTKALLHASHSFYHAGHMRDLGISATPEVKFKKLMDRVRGIVETGHSHLESGVSKNKNVTLLRERATFVDSHTVRVGGRTFKGKHILVSVGAKNFVPPIPGLDVVDYYDNENFLTLKKLPKSVVLIGGGYISMEFATFFAQLGCKVTVIEKFPSILGMLDSDVREVLLEQYASLGVRFITDCEILSVAGKTIKIVSVKKDGRVKNYSCDTLVVACGRVPNTSELGLEKAGVAVNERGGIVVNDYLQATPHIYALGDCLGHDLFAHAAKFECSVVVHNILKRSRVTMDFSIMPWAVFTSPVVSGVGLSENQLIKMKKKYDVYKSSFSRVGRAKIMNEDVGFVKILCDKRGKIIGASIVGINADDLIHEVVAFMRCGATIEDVRKTIHVHPTVSEVFGGI